MLKHIGSLIAFTLLAQAGSGIYLFLMGGAFLFPEFFNTSIYFGQGLGLLTGIIALIFSFTHLGYPMHALFALKNLKSSWLSREILFLSLWLFFMALDAVLTHFQIPTGFLWTIRFAAMLCSLLMILSMAKLYMLPTLPGWNKSYTPVSFFLSMLLIGNFSVLLLIISQIIPDPKGILFIFNGLTISILMLIGWLAKTLNPGQRKARTHRLLLIISWGAFLVGWLYMYEESSILNCLSTILIFLSFFIAALSLIIERRRFYASFQKLGV